MSNILYKTNLSKPIAFFYEPELLNEKVKNKKIEIREAMFFYTDITYELTCFLCPETQIPKYYRVVLVGPTEDPITYLK